MTTIDPISQNPTAILVPPTRQELLRLIAEQRVAFLAEPSETMARSGNWCLRALVAVKRQKQLTTAEVM